MIALGIDIGGSAVKAGLVDITGAVLASTSVETPTTPQAGPEGFLQAALTAAVSVMSTANGAASAPISAATRCAPAASSRATGWG